MNSNPKSNYFPVLCLTHNCNLNCVYCYQKHDSDCRMSFETAKGCIDSIFKTIISERQDSVEIDLIGGEPLLEFELIQQIYEYTLSKYEKIKITFFATTNGTVLTDKMKKWFSDRRCNFILGLSLDGTPDVHNKNRSNSFDKIDTLFFVKTYPEQAVKMTISEYSLEHLAESIKFIHSLGFKNIGGVNLFEGDFDWSKDEFIIKLIPQLKELVDFYVENDDLPVNQMLNRSIQNCESSKSREKKWCGTGVTTLFYNTDGKKSPCAFCSPMTFDKETIEKMNKIDFSDESNFVDNYCFNNCYIYPTCPVCYGANYLNTGTFNTRDKSRCRLQKLISLFVSDLFAKKIIKNPSKYSDEEKNLYISSINKIRELFLEEFKEFF